MQGAGLFIQVLTDQRTVLLDQALVRVRNVFTGAERWTTTHRRSEALVDQLAVGSYEVEVSAAGYGTVVQRVELQSFVTDRITVILKRDGSMPAFVALPTSGVPKDARKDTERGIQALKAGQFRDAERFLRKAHKKYPDSADLNYLLGVLFVERKDLAQAKTYLDRAVAIDEKHLRSLVTLGRVLLQEKDAAGAIGYLVRAVNLDAEQWMAHWLLANAYLRQAEYEKAEQAARTALHTGKGAASAARLPLGHALAYQGKLPPAIEELEAFLREVPGSPAAGEVRQVVAQLKNAVAEGSTVAPTMAVPLTDAATPEARMFVPNWGPPGVDDVKPFVAQGVACPDKRVIEGAGERLQEFISSLSRFEATEDVIHEEWNEVGLPITHETRKFSYVAELSEPIPGMPRVAEYRYALVGTERFPAGIKTAGLPSMAFVFHPKSRDNYDLQCEGLGEWQQQATWLVHFRQRESRPNYLLGYHLGQGMDFVDLKGRAWIAADSLRVVRIEAETIHPVPAIQLLSQHMTIEYGPIAFAEKNVELWLPRKADLYFHFRGHRYYRKHVFDNFRLFAVESIEKVTSPKEAPKQ